MMSEIARDFEMRLLYPALYGCTPQLSDRLSDALQIWQFHRLCRWFSDQTNKKGRQRINADRPEVLKNRLALLSLAKEAAEEAAQQAAALLGLLPLLPGEGAAEQRAYQVAVSARLGALGRAEQGLQQPAHIQLA